MVYKSGCSGPWIGVVLFYLRMVLSTNGYPQPLGHVGPKALGPGEEVPSSRACFCEPGLVSGEMMRLGLPATVALSSSRKRLQMGGTC